MVTSCFSSFRGHRCAPSGPRLGLLVLLATFGTAQAGGSISLDELMDHLKDNDKLIAEINAELQAQKLEADERHLRRRSRSAATGRSWAGRARSPTSARSAPASSTSTARCTSMTTKGAEVDDKDEKAPERATDYKETDLKWTWK